LKPFVPEEALGIMEAVMQTELSQVGVVSANWPQLLKRRDQTDSPPPYFSKVLPSKAQTEGHVSGKKPKMALRDMLDTAPPGRRPVLVRNFTRETACRVLGLAEADGPPDDAPLSEAGLDSLLAVELRNVIGKLLGMSLPATLLFDHPSIGALSEFLWSEMRGPDVPVKKQAEATNKPAARVKGSAVLAEIAELSDAEVELLLSNGKR
jgi:acyl carrier protein